MALPRIDPENAKKPLCYDPERGSLVFYDEIVSGKAAIVPVESLSAAELKHLVIERQRRGPDYRVQAMSGPPMSRDDVIRAIEQDEEFGRITVEAERNYLRELLAEIQKHLE
jgi:hypothetical protein